jgi:formylglycine-generating enzyme required for sulfatase activity
MTDLEKIKMEIENNMVFVKLDKNCIAYKEMYKNVPKNNADKLNADFKISRYPITQVQWQAVMGSNPSRFKRDDLPVEQVSWNDCNEFIKKLNNRTGKYCLPTEAGWEYAARGGIYGKENYKYAGSDNVKEVAWYYENSSDKELDDSKWDAKNLDKNRNRTHDVGLKLPNELGLYDMSGNVWEWCDNEYENTADRVLRGGGWYGGAEYCRVSRRGYGAPDDRDGGIGFRLCLSL